MQRTQFCTVYFSLSIHSKWIRYLSANVVSSQLHLSINCRSHLPSFILLCLICTDLLKPLNNSQLALQIQVDDLNAAYALYSSRKISPKYCCKSICSEHSLLLFKLDGQDSICCINYSNTFYLKHCFPCLQNNSLLPSCKKWKMCCVI